jgi:CHAT domain-containing protein
MRSLFIFLLSVIVAIVTPQIAHSFTLASTPATATESVNSQTISQASSSGNSPVASQDLLQQGIALYENQQFFEAVQRWQQANQDFGSQGNVLGQALTLSNLSLAYQQLGQINLAAQSIGQSLRLLESEPADRSTDRTEIYAKALNTQGKLFWLQNQLEAALNSWQQAAQAYAQVGYGEGMAIAQINQVKALQALGLSRQAQTLLQQIDQSLQQSPNAELKAIVLRNLGNALRQVGDLEASRDRLQESLSLTADPKSSSLTLLELGNTERAMSNRLLAIGRQAEAQSYLQAAMSRYQQAIDLDNSLSAGLNRLNALIQTGQFDEAIEQIPMLEQAIQQLPTGRSAVYAAIYLAETRMQLAKQSNSSKEEPLRIAQLLANAIQQAKTLNDARAESYALGQLGSLYEQTGQWTNAQTLTEQALQKMEPLQAPEIRYRWEWQLGRLAQYRGDDQGAIASYESAIATLQSIRSDLLSVNPDVQFSFRDNVEPVYREFIQLLLTSQPGQIPRQPELQQAIQTVNELQLAELENYLSCTLFNIGRVDEIQDANAALLYPILLRDTRQTNPAERLVVVAQFPQQSSKLVYYETLISNGTAEATIESLRENLSIPSRTPEVLADAQEVYNWIIKPLEPELEKTSVKTLVFVLDGNLRNIPMSVLHDGQQYLIEKGYAIAVAPRLQVFTPNPSPESLRVSLGGVSIGQTINGRQYPPIAKLQEELDRIARSVETGAPLINEAFTLENIRQQLDSGNFSAVHWKTHGTFSSDPAETYVVAYQERIMTHQLNDLIQVGSRDGARPLELLVLSACETARGDRRAVLGLAGLAARTGTRSVLSTLWVAQDTPNTEFMASFYQALSQPGMTKAEAVRQAQLNLMQKSGYTTPHIWGNYVLIGNWL